MARRRPPKPLAITPVGSEQEFQEYRRQIDAEVAVRLQQELELAPASSPFATPGFCFACQQWTEFWSSWDFARQIGGHSHVNWREHLLCRNCRLNNRMRACIHLLAETVRPTPRTRIYTTEQATPLYRYLRKSFPLVEGSEYLEDAASLGTQDATGLRNEDLTQLSFQDGSFDVILTFDVLEHVPHYQLAFAECVRTLRPDGKMLFSVPFDASSARNRIRAKILTDGTVEHLLTPEYHVHPRNPEGCLCFQHFGWEMFEQLREAGFRNVCALCYYSRDYGYLGGEQMQFLAEK